MSIELKADASVAVDSEYFWQPLSTCPQGVKVQLLTKGGIATYGQYRSSDKNWIVAWAPLPKKPDWLKAGLSQPPGEEK